MPLIIPNILPSCKQFLSKCPLKPKEIFKEGERFPCFLTTLMVNTNCRVGFIILDYKLDSIIIDCA